MNSPRPVTILDKPKTLAALFSSWDALDRLLSGLSDADWQQPTPLPGWSVHNVVAHIIGTESMLAGIPTPEVDISGAAHVRNQIGELNEKWVAQLAEESPQAMLARFREVAAGRRQTLTEMSETEWNTVGFTPAGPDTHGRFMRIRVFDCWMHEHDIRQAVGADPTDADLSAPDGQVALDEIAVSMGFVVGKRGEAPDGSRVQLDLTGPLARQIRVAVDGKAAVVQDFCGAAPTTNIRLDGLQFTRLCGGRPLYESRSGAIEYDGDQDTGQRIVEHLNYVI